MKQRNRLNLFVSISLTWIAPAEFEGQSAATFRDIANSAGVDFAHFSAPEKKYILESMSGGVALLDFNQDDLLDIYLVNSLTVERAGDPTAASSALYKNLGDGKFENVAGAAGVEHPGWGMGVCVADFNGDGHADLYVTTVGDNRLYRNNGDETFSDVAKPAGVTGGGWSAGCGFADYDRDGDLDLFVSRYLEVDLDALPEFGQGQFCKYRGIEVQCGPRGMQGTSDLLFRNRGDGTFEEVSEAAGVADANEYYGLGVAWFDADADGWLDLFVANDSGPNYLYRNAGDGTFKESGFLTGVAVSEDGGDQGSMGVALGDYRNDGRQSLFVTNFSEEYNAFYRNEEQYFSDVAFPSRTAASSLPYVGWGTTFFDYDNDGWQDLLVVNGHVYPQLENAKLGASAPYRQRKLLYRNGGDGTFAEIGEQSGEVFTAKRVGRGLAVGDLDNDGKLDFVVNDLDGKAQVVRNETANAGNWLMVKLVGKGKLTDAIGASVAIQVGESLQTRFVRSGTSYLSQDDMRLHFGLGAAERVSLLRVTWPDGSTTERKNVEANQLIKVAQDG